jgi:hypothetical protein
MRSLGLGLATAACFLCGCASLIVRPWDSTGETVAKVGTRVVLGVATLTVSELAIQNAKCEEDARYCRRPIDPSTAAIILQSTRPAPQAPIGSRPYFGYPQPSYQPAPVYQPVPVYRPVPVPPVPETIYCTSLDSGTIITTTCQ